MKHVLRSMRSLVCLEKRAHASELWAMGLEGGQECHIFQVGFEATTVIPCSRAGERIGQRRGLLCGPWRGGGGWAAGCDHLLEFLSSSSSLPVLCNRELRGGPKMSFFFFPMGRQTDTQTSILRMIFFSICREPEKG